MNEEKKMNVNQMLSDDELDAVNGGVASAKSVVSVWDRTAELALQAEYAANGAGMSLEAYANARMSSQQLNARAAWVNSADPNNAVGTAKGAVTTKIQSI